MLINLAAIIAVLGLLAIGIGRYHFILMDTKIKILKKAELRWSYTFVDARGAKRYKLLLTPALIKAGINDILKKESLTIGK